MPSENPFRFDDGSWGWRDENDKVWGPFKSQSAALKNLLKYMYFMEHGPTVFQKLWWPIRFTLWDHVKALFAS